MFNEFNNRVSQQFTLDTIGSCLFGIETNSLQNENTTLVNHLKQIFSISLSNFMIIVFRKSNQMTFSILIYSFLLVISPRLARSLGKRGYTILPRDTMNYLTALINQILSRRRQHLERRNDFIQIMVDHEKEMKYEEQISQQTDKPEGQQWGTLNKSMNELFFVLS